MKKLLSLVLAALMLLSLAACSGKEGNANEATQVPTEASTAEPTAEPVKTKDDLMASATEVSYTELYNMTFEDIAKAKKRFCGTDIIIDGYVRDIEADCAILTIDDSGVVLIDVFLPLEELVFLKERQKVTIVGHLDDDVEQRDENEAQNTLKHTHYSMKTAYVVTDVYEITGKLLGSNNRDPNAFNFAVPPTSNIYGLIYFADGVNTSKYATGGSDCTATITVRAKIDWDGNITEAVPVFKALS